MKIGLVRRAVRPTNTSLFHVGKNLRKQGRRQRAREIKNIRRGAARIRTISFKHYLRLNVLWKLYRRAYYPPRTENRVNVILACFRAHSAHIFHVLRSLGGLLSSAPNPRGHTSPSSAPNRRSNVITKTLPRDYRSLDGVLTPAINK